MRAFYGWVLKPIFFRLDPEIAHGCMTAVGRFLGNHTITKKLTKGFFGYSHPSLHQIVLGINFPNPIGLAAGFDKNAVLVGIIPSVGFGFMEVGSATGEPCEGNPKPRLWRLKKSQSLVVYYGLKNDGCEVVASRLCGKQVSIPVGISIAMTNCKETADTARGIEDYFKAYHSLVGLGDYVTINISCPNAFGGQAFVDSERLGALLDRLASIPKTKPLFLKLSPELDDKEAIDAIINTALGRGIDGFICSNLTKNRRNPKIIDDVVSDKGGLSGKVLTDLSDEMIRYVYRKTAGRAVIIGCGGVFTAEDAYKKIRAGASLIQLITGMIFEGPQVISEINMGLAKLIERDGFKTISEAVGADNKIII